MNKLVKVGVLCYIIFIMFLIVDFGIAKDSQQVHHRPRRYLSFRNNTHFFLRLNFKANMVWWNQIFAQALGFRINWNDPPDTFHPYHHLYRRSVFRNLEVLMDNYNMVAPTLPTIALPASPENDSRSPGPAITHPFHEAPGHEAPEFQNLLVHDATGRENGLNGYHCVRRAICEIGMIDQPTSVYYRILKMVFRRQSSSTDRWHNVTKEECPTSINSCPLSLLDVSLYTDM